MQSLTFENFTKYYIFNPCSETLSATDQTIATIVTAILAVLTLGLSHIACALFFYDRNFVRLAPPPPLPPLPPREEVIEEELDEVAGDISVTWDSEPLNATQRGLIVAESHDSYPDVSNGTKYKVRDETKAKLVKIFGWSLFTVEQQIDLTFLKSFVPGRKMLKHVYHYADPNSTFNNPDYLLGSFDVLSTPCRMYKDENWSSKPSQRAFFVTHAAAPNIGESANAEDFLHYSLQGSLNEGAYLFDLGRIVSNALGQQVGIGVETTVLFPFGMGAFLRNLHKNDARYGDDAKMFELRKKIAAVIIRQIGNFKGLEIRLCLPMDQEYGSQVNQNYNAFVLAIEGAPQEVQARIQLHLNTDATALAQRLAEQGADLRIGLLNGANRKLIGNRWFGDLALTAIDENIHRRSVETAFFSALFNNGFQYRSRAHNELADRVRDIQKFSAAIDQENS